MVLFKFISIHCISKPQRKVSTLHEQTQINTKRTKRLCCACFWQNRTWNQTDVKTAFGELAVMLTILSHTHMKQSNNKEQMKELTLSDIFTGLQLVRMLQKHLQIDKFNFYHPYQESDQQRQHVHEAVDLVVNDNDNTATYVNDINTHEMLDNGIQVQFSVNEKKRIKNAKYYAKYAIGSYGLPLSTLQNPCSICLHPPCCMPRKMVRQRMLGKACCGFSSVKVFLRKTKTNGSDLLLASQHSGIHQTTFFVSVDHETKNLVISIRGTESIPDSMTDANCKSEKIPEIGDDCYGHAGITHATRNIYQMIQTNKIIQNFLSLNQDYGIVVTGHSLGAGVTVLLGLFLLVNKTKNINYQKRIDSNTLHCYAFAPPPVVNTQFAQKFVQYSEKYMTTVIYGKDMIPRLQWLSITNVRSAVLRLLQHCNQSQWWVHRNAVNCTQNTILDAVSSDCEYLNLNNGTDSMENTIDIVINNNCESVNVRQHATNSLSSESDESKEQPLVKLSRQASYQKLMRDINVDNKNLSMHSINRLDCDPTLWSIRYQHVGMVFHMLKSNVDDGSNSNTKKSICKIICQSIGNCLIRCQPCHPNATHYIVYRADPSQFQDLIISGRMMSDHMPHVYETVLNSLHI